jgi:solute carrier family 25 aspartate/glutamate transporter 12/13
MSDAMSKATVVKEVVKESLIGSDEPVQLSAQSKARFLHHAKADPHTNEPYMGVDEFVDAVAPKDEDYVRLHREPVPVPVTVPISAPADALRAASRSST